MLFEERCRPGAQAEARAREVVRTHYPQAQSSYSESGAVVFDETTGKILGHGTSGDWAVEFAWQDAANALRQSA
jgi:membrane peptidoglycan carboxypeptidase